MGRDPGVGESLENRGQDLVGTSARGELKRGIRGLTAGARQGEESAAASEIVDTLARRDPTQGRNLFAVEKRPEVALPHALGDGEKSRAAPELRLA